MWTIRSLSSLMLACGIAVACGNTSSSPAGDGQGGNPGSGAAAGAAGEGLTAAGAAGERDGAAETAGAPASPHGGHSAEGGASGAHSGAGGAAVEVVAGAGGAGAGNSDGFEPGQCQRGGGAVEPSVPASCLPAAGDDACVACAKANACPQYQICYGASPASACGTGLERGSPGQFECVRQCFAAGGAGVVGEDELLFACADECAQSCPDALVNDETNELISVLRDECADACFLLE